MESVVSAFSAEQVQRLAGLSATQLREWDNTGFFPPAYAAEKRRSPYSRIYSFEDVVGLRVLSILRHEHKIPLSHLKNVAQRLIDHAGKPWSQLTLYVLNKEVHFRNPQTGNVEGAVSGQYAALIPIANVVDDMRSKADHLRRRGSDQRGKITKHRYVAHNEPVVAGTRIPIRAIRSFVNAGYSIDQIMREYPILTVDDVDAALEGSKDLTRVA